MWTVEGGAGPKNRSGVILPICAVIKLERAVIKCKLGTVTYYS